MLFCMMLLLPSAAVSGAETRARKVVRVPALAIDRLMVLDEEGVPVSGYVYDYVQMLATYAGWDIKYIPCDSFSEGVKKLLAGEVDLFYDISYTGERAEKLLFPDEPMGNEYYYLYTLDGNPSVVPGDYASMNGKTVGVTSGTMQIELLKEWCKKKNVKVKLVEYQTIQEKEADLRAGKIDVDLEVSMMAKPEFSAVEKVGISSYYLVANKGRPDLIDDINRATDKILNNDLFYFSRLQDRHFSETVQSRTLTGEEKNWIAEHKVLRIGFFDNYLPLSARDGDGNPTGAGIDAIREIVGKLNLEDKLKVEFVCCENQEAGYRAVESGKVDLMFPVYISSSVRRDYKIIGGKVVATLTSDLVFLRDFGDGAGRRIGVNRNNLMQYYYSRDSYPHSETVFYENTRECLDGVLNGESDGTFLNSLRTEALLKPDKYRSLKTERVRNGFQLRMAFAEDNIGLMLLMNRGLSLLDHDFFKDASYSYAGRINAFSIKDYLREHILSAIVTVAFLAALVVALVGFRISNRRLAGINRELTEYSATIEKQRREEFALRKQLEKKQEELEGALHMAQAASRAKTTFLSNMSHDIRTPMNAIIGFTGLAAAHIDDTERVRDYLGTIARSSEHLLSLINDVLEMSRIESGKITLNDKAESLSDILHALRDIVRADMRAKRHKFLIDAADIRNEFVYCDKMRLNQVLLNLVSNAVKYTPPGGTISLRVVQKPASDAGRGAFEFRCADNGIGISEGFIKTIFDPFTREENSTISGIQGTGLGMAITKSIVDMMGGRISVASKKGEGSEFTVTVEFRTAAGPVSDPAIPELKGRRALVVSGDAGACRNIIDMLREIGMRGERCASGDDAVLRAEEALRSGERFKVCVIDRPTPEAGGIETARRIRGAAGEDAPVVILTAYDWTDVEKEAGVAGFVTEPLFPSDLRKALLESLGKASPDRPNGEGRDFSFGGKRVLLVDDSRVNLKVGTLLLKERGMIVDTASNGQIAVDMIREKGIDAYDFVLMDIQMPVMGGYEATAEIRKLPDGDKLKIFAFSANAFEEDRERSLQAGMNGHIAKPLKIGDLLKELKRFAV